jgi:hypothetical protein
MKNIYYCYAIGEPDENVGHSTNNMESELDAENQNGEYL